MKTLLLTLASALILAASAWGLIQAQAQPVPAARQALRYQPSTPQPGGLPQVRLRASDYHAHDYFGYAVAIDGQWLAAGAPGAEAAGDEAGAVYVFRRGSQGWEEQARLVPDGLGPGDQLGMAVALDGDTLVVGAPYATSETAGYAAGAIYVFVRQGDGWRQQARLTARDGLPFDLFGGALALDGDTLVVGARAADGPSVVRNSGAAYVYQRQAGAWVEAARLAVPGGENDFFGQAVALQDDWIAVGAFGRDDPQAGPNAGMVYLFQRRNGRWYAHSALSSAQTSSNAQFGYALQFTGGEAPAWLAVGANQYSSQAVDPRYGAPPGRLELFQWKDQGWQPAIQLQPEIDASKGEGYYGSTLAIGSKSEERLILASAGLFSRSVRLYPVTGQAPSALLSIEPENVPINFGCSLAISANWLAVGSRTDFEPALEGQMNTYASSSGAVYVYDLNGLK